MRAIRQYILNAQRADRQGMANVLDSLTKISRDTERLNQRIDTTEKTNNTLSTSMCIPGGCSEVCGGVAQLPSQTLNAT